MHLSKSLFFTCLIFLFYLLFFRNVAIERAVVRTISQQTMRTMVRNILQIKLLFVPFIWNYFFFLHLLPHVFLIFLDFLLIKLFFFLFIFHLIIFQWQFFVFLSLGWELVEQGDYIVKIKKCDTAVSTHGFARTKRGIKRTYEVVQDDGINSYNIENIPAYKQAVRGLKEGISSLLQGLLLADQSGRTNQYTGILSYCIFVYIRAWYLLIWVFRFF